MKIDRIEKDIEKTSAKIDELQTRLRELQRQKTEAENTEIVSLVRSIELTPQELAEFVKAFRESGKAPAYVEAPPTYTTGQEDNDDEE